MLLVRGGCPIDRAGILAQTRRHVETLGGPKQQRARGTLAGVEYASNVIPAGSGRLTLSVSKSMMTASHSTVGEDVDVEISGIGRD